MPTMATTVLFISMCVGQLWGCKSSKVQDAVTTVASNRRQTEPLPWETSGLWFVLVNHTGKDLWHFSLTTGAKPITYEIFSNNYTFVDDVRIAQATQLSYTYSNARAQKPQQRFDIPFQAHAAYNGHRLELTFELDGRVTVKHQPYRDFGWSKEWSNPEWPTLSARRMYDALQVGMTRDQVATVLDDARRLPHTDRITRGFRAFGQTQQVQLIVDLVQDRLRHVSLTHQALSEATAQLIAEKGF